MSLYDYFVEPCVDPAPLNNGKVIVSGRTPGSNATYSCNDHYRLIGNPTVVCQSDSQWLGVVPKCRGMYICMIVISNHFC